MTINRLILSNGLMFAPQGISGLDMRMAMDLNRAFLAKLAWQKATCDKLWVQAMRDKYIRNGDFFTVEVHSCTS